MQRWVFMGNPGSGKSTLLNCLLQRPVFDAGLSFGGGRTQTAQVERWNDDIIVIDTPGVADVEMRQDACDAITAALKHGGVYKLFFVVTIRNGRAPPEDVETYNEVLRSIAVADIKFSLIINHVEKQQHELITGSQEASDRAIAGLGGGDYLTDSILFIPTMPELDEEDNAVVQLPDFVLDFLAAAPTCEIPPTAVGKINTDADIFQAKSAELASGIHAMQQEQTALQSQLNRSISHAGPYPSATGAAHPKCNHCGRMDEPDEIMAPQFCPECGKPRGPAVRAIGPPGAGVTRAAPIASAMDGNPIRRSASNLFPSSRQRK